MVSKYLIQPNITGNDDQWMSPFFNITIFQYVVIAYDSIELIVNLNLQRPFK
jgi:hypothetical protein